MTVVRTPWSTAFGDDPRSLAAWISFHEAIAGRSMKIGHPYFWEGASASEAWHFDLDPDHNRGDGSAIPAFSNDELARQELLAATLQPRTRWIQEWGDMLIAEHQLRKEEGRI